MATPWTDEELKASVQAYVQMLVFEKAGSSYKKSVIYQSLSTEYSKSAKAFEYRMQNISYLLLVKGWLWIPGLKPAAHVGAQVSRKLLKFLFEEAAANPTAFSKATLEQRAEAIAAKANDDGIQLPLEAGLTSEDFGFSSDDVALLDETLRLAAQLASKAAAASGAIGSDKPLQSSSLVQQYARDSAVVNWVILRAQGTCECCRRPAPFADKRGQPYLEVHHVRPLAAGGSDRITNAVAVCPNCHRRLHHGSDSDTYSEKLFENVHELRRE